MSKVNFHFSPRSIFTTLILICLSQISLGQQSFEVTGRIVDENQQPIQDAETFSVQNQQVTSFVITNEDGSFTLNVPKGLQHIRIQSLGMVLYATDIDIQNNKDLGIVIAFETGKELSEIQINTKRKIYETKVDRNVFNIENSTKATGSNGYDLLKSTPHVFVQGNSIGIAGKGTVSVMINDKIVQMSGEDLANYLRTVPSENIKRIEVITTPPAKYAADGNSGLINIVLKDAIQDAWNLTTRMSYKQASYATFTPGANFTFQKNKISLTADYIHQHGYDRILEKNTTFYSTDIWDSHTNRKDLNNIHRGILGLDYKPTEKATIGAKYTGYWNTPDIADRNITKITSPDGELVQIMNTNGYNASDYDNQNWNLYYTQKLKKETDQFSIDLDYFNYSDLQDRVFTTYSNLPTGNNVDFVFGGNNYSHQKIENYSLKLDFEIEATWAKLSFGGRGSQVENVSDIKFFAQENENLILDPLQTNLFEYSEDTYAGYFTIQKEWNEKWQSQIGVRYETTKSEGTTSNTNNVEKHKFSYDKFFPTAYLMYQPSENHTWNFNYSKRIGRPAFESLNPYRWYFNPYYAVSGNPYIQPSFTDNLELSYNYKGEYTFKFFLSQTKNGSFQVPYILLENDPPTNYIYWDNFYNTLNYGILGSYNGNLTNWWENTTSAGNYRASSKFLKDVEAQEQNGWIQYVYTSNTFQLNKRGNFTGEISYLFSTKGYNLFNQISSYDRLELGLSYNLKEKGLTFALYASDILRGSQRDVTSVFNSIPQLRSNYLDERSVRLSISYRIGNTNIRHNYRDAGNEAEQDRLK